VLSECVLCIVVTLSRADNRQFLMLDAYMALYRPSKESFGGASLSSGTENRVIKECGQ